MDDKMDNNELISALADGQLRGEVLAQTVQAVCADRAAVGTWHAYHVIGDVLRSGELGQGASFPEFIDKLSARLAQEKPVAVSAVLLSGALPGNRTLPPAANDADFRWKMVAGLASVAAVAALGWSVLGLGLESRPLQPQLAVAPLPAASAPATVLVGREPGIMIRDPKLDELLAAHREFGGASALQMPTGFLRNATFEGQAR